ncbi:MAG TPA: sialate O-acetylesterase [Opitutaceae bacterium]|nr:sialate O-acetylesterase [Opitutaceae bacterium]
MKLSRRIVLSFTLVGIGIALGVFIQHRWPLGRLRAELNRRPSPTTATLQSIASIPPERRLVLVVAGQSNAANYGATRAMAGASVYAFSNGQLFEAVDPLPGGDGDGGSIWTRLGARLAMAGDYDAVIFAVVAQGSSTAQDWAPHGRHHFLLVDTLHQLARANLRPDFILWQQGETEAGQAAAPGRDYLLSLEAVQAGARAVFPDISLVVAQASYIRGAPRNEQVRLAQLALPAGMVAGPDLDQLGSAYRGDGIHFNEAGLAQAAELWHAALRTPLMNRRPPTP